MKSAKTARQPLKPFTGRILIICLILLVVFGAVFVRLYTMMISGSEKYVSRAETKSTKTITVYGKRGTIYDTNMVPLAYDETSYNVTFYRDPTKSSEADRRNYTNVLIETIKLIESNGKSTVNDLWLKKDEQGVWRFNSGSDSPAVERTRKNQWCANFYMNGIEEEDYWDVLCEKYCIPEDTPEDLAAKVLSLWQESRMNAFNSTPVEIAYNVGFETVSEIESRSMELDGINIEESSSRVYPLSTTACHLTGYISKISASQLETYREQGYPNNAYIGAAGIEYSLEDQLSPYIQYRQGSKQVEISTKGKVVRELNYTPPTDGNSVILTVDVDLEKEMAEALKENIESVHETQVKTVASGHWQRNNVDLIKKYNDHGWEISMAETGAMVCMDPHSGRILGIVSYPDYDLSMFNGGQVNNAKWNEVLEMNDPLYNRAISTRDTPGSIFKLCTALAGLTEGVLSPTERISDLGSFTLTNATNPAKCWIKPENRHTHANQTVVEALKNSCNYFFYTVSYRLGITKLYEWASKLGLTSKTNIELPGESTSFVGNQVMLYDPERTPQDQYTSKPELAADMLRKLIAKIEVERDTEFGDEITEKAIMDLLKIAVSYEQKTDWYAPIREIFQYDLGLPRTYIQNHYLVNTVTSYLQDIFWTPNETIMVGIGQSITQLTPVCVARYVSAICNGGTVYDAQIIDKIIGADGQVILDKQPVVANQIESDPVYFALIRQGMEEVASAEDGGTAGSYFAEHNEKYTYKIAAKTGTSERTECDIENNGWLVTYAPADDPKIVCVVYIQNGYGGAYCSPAAIRVIEYYLDSLGYTEGTTAVAENTIAD